MAKKKEGLTAQIRVRVRPSDKKEFEQSAWKEGFSNVSAWVQYHLRRAARKQK